MASGMSPLGTTSPNVRKLGGLSGGAGVSEENVRSYAAASRLRKFKLTSQVRRAAVSLTNNIAEGHGRYHFADQVRFSCRSRIVARIGR